ncbi:MAG: ferredoxin--NADP reductase [Acidimicrobiales bacterium]
MLFGSGEEDSALVDKAPAPRRPDPPPGRPFLPPPDIFVLPPSASRPLSRSARERRLERSDRYDRRAVLRGYEALTPTGTVRLTFEVVDEHPFNHRPGYFVGIRTDVEELGPQRSPYCIFSPPDGSRTFELLVRLVPEGPVSCYLAAMELGDEITFRGPSGRSMIPKEDGTELVMLATGVGVGPLLALSHHLLSEGFDRPITLFWGLRLVEDICLQDQLEALSQHPNFGYHISLSQAPDGWTGLRGRVTETVPPRLATLSGKHFYLVGNGAMIEEMYAALSDMGVDELLIHTETYFNVKYRPTEEAVAEIRRRFVATDLFTPYAHQEAGLFMPERPVRPRSRRRR